VGKADSMRIWEEDLDYIAQTSGGHLAQGTEYNNAEGVWGYDKGYILDNICGRGASGFCK